MSPMPYPPALPPGLEGLPPTMLDWLLKHDIETLKQQIGPRLWNALVEQGTKYGKQAAWNIWGSIRDRLRGYLGDAIVDAMPKAAGGGGGDDPNGNGSEESHDPPEGKNDQGRESKDDDDRESSDEDEEEEPNSEPPEEPPSLDPEVQQYHADLNDDDENLLSFREFLPQAGSLEIVEDMDDDDDIIRQHLEMSKGKPMNWPLGNVDNPLWVDSMVNKGMCAAYGYEIMPPVLPGSTLNAGAIPAGSRHALPRGSSMLQPLRWSDVINRGSGPTKHRAPKRPRSTL